MTRRVPTASCRVPTAAIHARWFRGGLLLAALALSGSALVAGGGAGPAMADSHDTDDPSSLRLTVTELSGVLGPGSLPPPSEETPDVTPVSHDLEVRALIENDGPVVLDALQFVVEVHPEVSNAQELARALRGDLSRSGQNVHVHTQPIREGGPLRPGEIAGLQDLFTRSEVLWAEDAGGVHPVRIAVTRGTDVLTEAVTAVVWLAESPEHPLSTTMVWPLDTAPWRAAGGTYPAGADREMRTGARLDVLLSTLERAGGAPVTLAPAPHLLEDLSDRADGFVALERLEEGALESRVRRAGDPEAQASAEALRRIRELAGSLPFAPVTGGYADSDLEALTAGSAALREMAAVAAVDGRRRLQLQLGREVDATAHLVGGPIGQRVLDLLPAETLLLPAAATTDVAAGPPARSASLQTVRSPSGRLLTAAVADPHLESALAAPPDPAGAALTVQTVIAHTAVVYLQEPAVDQRSLLLLPPRRWDPPPRVAADLLAELREATWLRLSSPTQLVNNGRRAAGSIELATPTEPTFPDELATALTNASIGLDAARAALPEGTSRLQDRSPVELEDELLRASSSWFRGTSSGEAEAAALIRNVQRTVDATFGDVTVATGAITLTSDTGQIPITLQRSRGGPIAVVIEVASPGRLVWPEGRRSDPLVLAEGSSQTVSFATEAVSAGTFPVTVRVTDPTGIHELARATLSVRSTTISGPALFATGGIIVMLLLAGALRRKPQRPALEVVD